eukprot:TRINITY_DN3023_c0_g1_i3.p1 TRINITY_DN3023_c0_g1~~TRINITY_DN3023_c0_g1_i3.p1  ORF type:complete len:690 (-),score=76.75 TRINITY_DN3023_c0_g1_i3:124-1932(-)
MSVPPLYMMQPPFVPAPNALPQVGDPTLFNPFTPSTSVQPPASPAHAPAPVPTSAHTLALSPSPAPAPTPAPTIKAEPVSPLPSAPPTPSSTYTHNTAQQINTTPSKLVHKDDIYCELCDVVCSGAEPYAQHISGRKHRSLVASTEGPPSQGLFCDLCKVHSSSESAMQQHIAGKSHNKKLDAQKAQTNHDNNNTSHSKVSSSSQSTPSASKQDTRGISPPDADRPDKRQRVTDIPSTSTSISTSTPLATAPIQHSSDGTRASPALHFSSPSTPIESSLLQVHAKLVPSPDDAWQISNVVVLVLAKLNMLDKLIKEVKVIGAFAKDTLVRDHVHADLIVLLHKEPHQDNAAAISEALVPILIPFDTKKAHSLFRLNFEVDPRTIASLPARPDAREGEPSPAKTPHGLWIHLYLTWHGALESQYVSGQGSTSSKPAPASASQDDASQSQPSTMVPGRDKIRGRSLSEVQHNLMLLHRSIWIHSAQLHPLYKMVLRMLKHFLHKRPPIVQQDTWSLEMMLLYLLKIMPPTDSLMHALRWVVCSFSGGLLLPGMHVDDPLVEGCALFARLTDLERTNVTRLFQKTLASISANDWSPFIEGTTTAL